MSLKPSLEEKIGQHLMIAFQGLELSPEIRGTIQKYKPGGVTLFRSLNIDHLQQVKQLTGALQEVARDAGVMPLLIAADQEGGQLMAIGDGTPLPGNMALGATRSIELAHQAGQVLGREMAALGINVDYTPCADVNINPQNPVVGVRSFGEDPKLVAELTAAMIAGIQSQGVAATVKHFPGHGDTASDSHYGLGIVSHSLERLYTVELTPFRAALKADTKLVMTAHLGIRSIDGPNAPPATLSPNIINGLLRGELGYDGVVITDAMDMRTIHQGKLLGQDALRAMQAGADLLLLASDPQDHFRVYEALLQGVQGGLIDYTDLQDSVERITRLKNWLRANNITHDLSVIRCTEHMQIAKEIAEKSITLVRDKKKNLPLRLETDKHIAVIIPTPQDLTPADTSSYIQPGLAESIREYHAQTDEFKIPLKPNGLEIASVVEQVHNYDLVVIGTINAYSESGQAELVRQLLGRDKPTIIIAMRLPYDLAAFPNASTFVCTYSILEPSMLAVAKAIFGFSEMAGRLPVSIPGLVETD